MKKSTSTYAFDSHPCFQFDPDVVFRNHGPEVIVHLGLLCTEPDIGIDLSKDEPFQQWLDENGREELWVMGESVGLHYHGHLAHNLAIVVISKPKTELSFDQISFPA